MHAYALYLPLFYGTARRQERAIRPYLLDRMVPEHLGCHRRRTRAALLVAFAGRITIDARLVSSRSCWDGGSDASAWTPVDGRNGCDLADRTQKLRGL